VSQWPPAAFAGGAPGLGGTPSALHQREAT